LATERLVTSSIATAPVGEDERELAHRGYEQELARGSNTGPVRTIDKAEFEPPPQAPGTPAIAGGSE
jgi:hypothetical protein